MVLIHLFEESLNFLLSGLLEQLFYRPSRKLADDPSGAFGKAILKVYIWLTRKKKANPAIESIDRIAKAISTATITVRCKIIRFASL